MGNLLGHGFRYKAALLGRPWGTLSLQESPPRSFRLKRTRHAGSRA